jgi:hypothetical protein
MKDILGDFDYRSQFLQNLSFDEANVRISGFIKWLEKEEVVKSIIDDLANTVDAKAILINSGYGNPPKASTPEEIAAVGLQLMIEIGDGAETFNLSDRYGISPTYNTNASQDFFNEIMNRYINPSIDFIRRELVRKSPNKGVLNPLSTQVGASLQYPLEISESLVKFLQDYPYIHRNAFVMMKFGKTKTHDSIIDTIKSTLNKYDINALRADDKQYHDDLFPNVLTYMYGCRFGIAVFERLEEDDFNPNVSLEVDYMNALKKSVCLLKDKTLKTLQTDLVGKLYKIFDPQDIINTIPSELEKWLRDKDLINI